MNFADLSSKSGSLHSRGHAIKDIQSRIVALIDMDCFYVQVEQRLAPEWFGKPCAVVQYNEWKGGGIIAVGYEARAMGVTRRGMRGEDAREVCPDIKLFKVPEVRGKADLTRYREAGAEVIAVLMQFGKCRVERASVDEAYVDMTDEIEDMMSQSHTVTSEHLPNTFIVGTDDAERETSVRDWLQQTDSDECLDAYNNRRLALGALLLERMRKAVKDKTGFNCSAGVSHNKVLSKLACGLHKPQKQTILSLGSVAELFATHPIPKVRHLGGKLGQQVMEDYGIQYMGDICRVEKQELVSRYGDKTGNFLYDLCRGHDPEPVSSRQLVKSVGCSKNFRGHLIITGYKKAQHWIRQLSLEMEERLIKDREQNRRYSKSLALYVRFTDWQSVSRAIPLTRYSQAAIETSAMAALTKLCGEGTTKFDPGINCLGLSAGKFEDIEGQNLTQLFQKAQNGPLVDPFNSLTSSSQSNNPTTPTKSHCGIKAFTSARVSPFDSFSASPKHKEDMSEPQKKSVGCGIKPFVASAQPVDPFESLEKSHPRINDNKQTAVELEPPFLQTEKSFDMKSFLVDPKSVDPFERLEKMSHKFDSSASPLKIAAKTKPSSTQSIKLFAAAGSTLDPFAATSPKKRKPKPGGIQKYFKSPKSRQKEELAGSVEAEPVEASVPVSSHQRPTNPASLLISAPVQEDGEESLFFCKPSAEDDILDEIIDIWKEEHTIGASPPTSSIKVGHEESTETDESSLAENESELSFFEVVEEEERMFHRLTSVGSSKAGGSLIDSSQGNRSDKFSEDSKSRPSSFLKKKRHRKQTSQAKQLFGLFSDKTAFDGKENKELRNLSAGRDNSTHTEASVDPTSVDQQDRSRSRDEDEDISVIWEANKLNKKQSNDRMKPGVGPNTQRRSREVQKSAALKSTLQFTLKDFFS